MKQINKILSISIITSSFLLAQTPNIGTIEKEIKQPKIENKTLNIPQIDSLKKTQNKIKENGKTIFIKKFVFSGNKHINTKILNTLAKEYENKDLTFSQIQKFTSKITQYYSQLGYFTSRAYIPKQSIQNEFLEIAILEGNYGNFKVANKSLVNDNIIEGIFNEAKKTQNIVSINDIEKSMLIANDTPGILLSKINIRPGGEIGTSDFLIHALNSGKYSGYLLTDNAGSRYTGKYRLLGGLNINSPFKIGDKLSLFGLVSQGNNLDNIRLAYSIPLSFSGLRSEVYYSQTNYSLVKEYKDLDAKGTAQTLGIEFSYPIIRSKAENLFSKINIERKYLKDEQLSSTIDSKKATILNLGLEYNKEYLLYGINSIDNINFIYTHGNIEDNYNKLFANLSKKIQFTEKLSLNTNLSMQYSLENKNLDGSEDFSIGGINGVKLYPSGELSAENGYLFNIEGKYKLPSINSFNSSIGIFYDRGRVFMANNNVNFEAKALQDIGLGYYFSYKNIFGQIQIAWNANSDKITSEANSNSRTLFQIGMIF